MTKKMLAIFMALIMVLGSTVMAGAEMIEGIETIDIRLDTIKEMILADDSESSTFAYTYVMSDQGIILSGVRKEADDSITVEMVFPFIIDEEGNAQNTFTYVTESMSLGGTASTMASWYSNIANSVTLKVRGNYTTAYHSSVGNYYRPGALQAYYSTSSSAINVQNIWAMYIVEGDLINTSGSYETVQQDYYRAVTIDQNNPTNEQYYSNNIGMSSSRALICNDPEHGGYVSATLDYLYNGSAKQLRLESRPVFTIVGPIS